MAFFPLQTNQIQGYLCKKEKRQCNKEHWWFSGRILACHAGGPGSIPGPCRVQSLLVFTPTLPLDSLRCTPHLLHIHRHTPLGHWATAHTLWPVSLASPHSDNYLEPPSNHLTHSPPPTRNYTLSLPTRLHHPLMLSLLHLLLQGVIYLFSGGTLSLSLDTPEDTTYTRFIRFHYTWLGATMCLLAIKLRTSVRAIGALTH